MSTAMEKSISTDMPVNPVLLSAVNTAVGNAFEMCEVSIRCVGVSCVPARDVGKITGMIGVHGKVSGFVTLNMSERFAIAAVEGLLQDNYGELTSQVVDGAGEITNIVVGGIKSSLSKTEYGFSQITVPSIIVGKGYSIAYARGLDFLNVTYEHNDPEAVLLEDRLIHVTVSLLTI